MIGRKVTPIEQRIIDELAAGIAPRLEQGSVMRDTANIGNVDHWRRAARQAARANGWRIRTGVTPNGQRAWAVREDREPTEEELRHAGDVVSQAIDDARRQAHRNRLTVVDDAPEA